MTLQRRTPLARGTKGLKRSEFKRSRSELARTEFKRKTPMPSARIPFPRPASDPQTSPKVERAPTGQAVRLKAQEARLRAAKDVVKDRALDQCEHCHLPLAGQRVETHHRKPRGMGGSSDPAIHSPANLIRVRWSCHLAIEAGREESFVAGWLVESETDPAVVPLRYRGGPWRLLDGAGGTAALDAPADADARLLAVEVAARSHPPFSVP